MRLKGKKIVCFILTMILCVTMARGYVRADDTKAQGINVIYHTQEEIKNFCNESGVTVDDELTYAEEPVVSGSYSAGKLSDKTLNSAVKMLNCVRYIAGISSDVQLNADYNSMTQAAALVDYVNGRLSHYPEKPADMDESLYELGASGACHSNIAWASWSGNSLNWSIINGWMEDGDPSNIDKVGHRRWILNPEMKYTGFGAVSGEKGTYSAMYSLDTQNSEASEYGVAWPAQNMPVEYFGTTSPWSVSMGKIVDITSVKVKLTRKSDGKTWNFSNDAADGYFNVSNGGYGQGGCIIFRPKMSERYRAGDIYNVNITGLGNGNDVSYSVNFFRLAESTQEPTEEPTVTPTTEPTQKPTEEPTVTPTTEPTQKPTEEPTVTPTTEPTQKPTEEPTVTPTTEPTEEPTVTPTTEPTEEPTVTPATEPTEESTVTPTAKPAAIDVLHASVSGKKIKFVWKKLAKVDGYQIQYSTSVKFKKGKNTITKKVKTNSYTIKNYKKKTCYMRVRAYKKVNGKYVYGKWSGYLPLRSNF